MFSNRIDAGKRLANRLGHLRGPDTVVVGLPRGGVPVAAEVARELEAPLDVILVRKLGVPFQPELGMGAIGEDGVRVINADIVRMVAIDDREVADVEALSAWSCSGAASCTGGGVLASRFTAARWWSSTTVWRPARRPRRHVRWQERREPRVWCWQFRLLRPIGSYDLPARPTNSLPWPRRPTSPVSASSIVTSRRRPTKRSLHVWIEPTRPPVIPDPVTRRYKSMPAVPCSPDTSRYRPTPRASWSSRTAAQAAVTVHATVTSRRSSTGRGCHLAVRPAYTRRGGGPRQRVRHRTARTSSRGGHPCGRR